MALAKKCDRCGKLHEYYEGIKEFNDSEKANGVILIDRDLDRDYWSRKSYDLCINCMRKLEAFIENEADIGVIRNGKRIENKT